MAALNGDEVNERMEGSTSAITGETHSGESKSGYGPWNPWTAKSDGVRTRTSCDGEDTLMSKGQATNSERDSNHLHFYEDDKTGERVAKDKATQTEYISEKIGNGIRNFMGW
jgi:hypothetical protein